MTRPTQRMRASGSALARSTWVAHIVVQGMKCLVSIVVLAVVYGCFELQALLMHAAHFAILYEM